MFRVFTNGPGDLGSIPDQVSYQRFKKWYLMPSCLTLSIIRYGSRVKWVNPEKGVEPSLHLSKREPLGHLQLQSPTLLTHTQKISTESEVIYLGFTYIIR